jgi:hypothetical protein
MMLPVVLRRPGRSSETAWPTDDAKKGGTTGELITAN